MTVAEKISHKIVHLPMTDQEEVLELVERIENFRNNKTSTPNGSEKKHSLTLIAEMAVDMGIKDLAERHDFYAHGKLEE